MVARCLFGRWRDIRSNSHSLGHVMSQGARTRNFMTQPHSSLRTPREASPAFQLRGHHSATPPRPVISDRAVCLGAVALAALALLIVNLT